MSKTKAELEKENKTMRNKLREVVAERDGLKEEIKQLVEEMKEEQKSHEAYLAELTTWYEEMCDKHDSLEAENRALKEEQKSIHDNYIKATEKIEEWKEKAIGLNELLGKVQEERDDSENELEYWKGVASDVKDGAKLLKEELSADNMRLQSEIADYLEKIRELQNELTTKETSLEYFEKGLRSAEREVIESRKTNRNLLNYIHILAAQDNPNLPDNFTY